MGYSGFYFKSVFANIRTPLYQTSMNVDIDRLLRLHVFECKSFLCRFDVLYHGGGRCTICVGVIRLLAICAYCVIGN